MLRITKQTDYAIVLLSKMATTDRLVKAPDLAEETHLPGPTVSKILKILSREGLLESHRGVKGGYTLNRAAEDISVAEVIEALEGPIAVTECVDEAPGACEKETSCPMSGNWHRINVAIRRALDGITLVEMTHPAASKLVQLGTQSSTGEQVGELI